MTKRAIEQSVLREMKALGVGAGEGLLVAVSGGVDSVVLLKILAQFRRHLGYALAVAHVHHGEADSKRQTSFRNRSARLVQKMAKQLSLPLFTNLAERRDRPLGGAEAGLREYRYGHLEKWQQAWSEELKRPVLLVTAHHLDDLVETRLLRLVRGTGGEGLMAMSVRSRGRLRPLLSLRSSDLRAYAKAQHLSWVEDPSNQDLDPLRNWMRRKWLKDLDKRQPGAVLALARSLDILARELMKHRPNFAYLWQGGFIDRTAFVQLPADERRQALAQYMRDLGLKDYSDRHVREIVKRLDNPRREHSFKMLRMNWRVTDTMIQASRG